MNRHPRGLELAIARAAAAAEHILEIDDPMVRATKLLARKIDEHVAMLEQAVAAGNGPTLFEVPCPGCGVTSGPCLSKRDQSPIKTRHSGRASIVSGALANEGGSMTYDLQQLHVQLTGLGLTPQGRHQLDITTETEDDDALGAILELHANG